MTATYCSTKNMYCDTVTSQMQIPSLFDILKCFLKSKDIQLKLELMGHAY